MKSFGTTISSYILDIVLSAGIITVCSADRLLAAETFQLSKGTVSADIGWTTDRITGEDVLRGKIVFTPNSEGPNCNSIRMIQVAKVLESPDVFDDHLWDRNSGNYDRNFIRTLHNEESSITGGYFIDYLAVNCAKGRPCAPYYRDHFPNSDESHDGRKDHNEFTPASLVDYPFGWSIIYTISLETCSVCTSGRDTTVMGCVKWGATWPLSSPRQISPVEASHDPSKTFTKALDNFNRYYSNEVVIHEPMIASYYE
jgi:hypothetical protein